MSRKPVKRNPWPSDRTLAHGENCEIGSVYVTGYSVAQDVFARLLKVDPSFRDSSWEEIKEATWNTMLADRAKMPQEVQDSWEGHWAVFSSGFRNGIKDFAEANDIQKLYVTKVSPMLAEATGLENRVFYSKLIMSMEAGVGVSYSEARAYFLNLGKSIIHTNPLVESKAVEAMLLDRLKVWQHRKNKAKRERIDDMASEDGAMRGIREVLYEIIPEQRSSGKQIKKPWWKRK